MDDLITRKARLNEASEQNHFISEKTMIMNPLSPRPNYLFRKLWIDKKFYMCLYVWMCLHVFVFFFVCILYVCVFASKQAVTMLEKVSVFL